MNDTFLLKNDFIDLRSQSCRFNLRKIIKCKPSVQTECAIEKQDNSIIITINAEDSDMLNLIASVSEPNTDNFLYDEDCVQIAIAEGIKASVDDFILINPRGSRRIFGSASNWEIKNALRALGWQMEIRIPIKENINAIGLSVHRYYRGVTGEVHSLWRNLPHPLEPSKFVCLILCGTECAEEISLNWHKQTTRTEKKHIRNTVQKIKERIKKASQTPQPHSFLPLAINLAQKRLSMEIISDEGFLCWNEAHFQHSLMDLWEITGDNYWIEAMIPRVEKVWQCIGTARNIIDSLWKKALPTWYNNTETGSACTLASGAILWPISRLIRTVVSNPELQKFSKSVSAWIQPSEKIIELHDKEWIDFPDGSGMHFEPYLKGPPRMYPRGGSRINPLNREFFLTLPMINLYAVNHKTEYKRKIEANALYFKNTSDITKDTFCWEYLVAACPSTGEDLAHASCQVAFVEQCFEDKFVFTEDDLRKIAGTLAKKVFKYGNVPTGTLRGYYPSLDLAVAVWSSLCRFVPSVFPKICAVIHTAICEGDKHFTGEHGWGIRLLTNIEKTRKKLELSSQCTA